MNSFKLEETMVGKQFGVTKQDAVEVFQEMKQTLYTMWELTTSNNWIDTPISTSYPQEGGDHGTKIIKLKDQDVGINDGTEDGKVLGRDDHGTLGAKKVHAGPALRFPARFEMTRCP